MLKDNGDFEGTWNLVKYRVDKLFINATGRSVVLQAFKKFFVFCLFFCGATEKQNENECYDADSHWFVKGCSNKNTNSVGISKGLDTILSEG
jgi:hypothetical protein